MSPCISSYLRLPTKKFKFVNNDLKRTINTPKNISQNILGNEYRYQPYILSWLMTHGYVLHAFVMMTFVSFVITWVSISIMRPLHVSPSSPHSQLRPISMYSQETAKQSNEKRLHSLDFFIAGFPKCGTTTLLYSFRDNNETIMPSKEYCPSAFSNSQSPSKLNSLRSTLSNLDIGTSKNTKWGIKCPMAIRDIILINGLIQISEELRIIIGVRHPVHLFQSFYNYRVTEMYVRKKVEHAPNPEKLTGQKGWKGVSTNLVQFEFSLMQLAKTFLSTKDLMFMSSRGLSVLKPNSIKIFLYSLEQIKDQNETRSALFRASMQQFLGLENPIEPFTHENNNKAVKYPETINICDEKFNKLRKMLILNGKATQKWILNQFMQSKDVIVGVQDQFIKSLEKWSDDPCSSKTTNFGNFTV